MNEPAEVSRISTPDLRALENQIAGMTQHENELINHRLQWFLTLNGLLFGSLALYGDRPVPTRFLLVLAMIGVLAAVSFRFALEISGRAIKRLEDLWDGLKKRGETSFVEVDVIGYRYRGVFKVLFPWRALPVVIAIGWMILASSVFFPSTIPANAEPQLSITRFDDGAKPTVQVRYQGTVDGLRQIIPQLEEAAKAP